MTISTLVLLLKDDATVYENIIHVEPIWYKLKTQRTKMMLLQFGPKWYISNIYKEQNNIFQA